MPRAAAAFKRTDVERAVLGARAAGIAIERVEIDPKTGRIVIVARNEMANSIAADLDAELLAFEGRHEGKA
jgi:hypothetical protein